MTDLQTRLRASTSYDFGPHPEIARLITNAKPMSEEVSMLEIIPRHMLTFFVGDH